MAEKYREDLPIPVHTNPDFMDEEAYEVDKFWEGAVAFEELTPENQRIVVREARKMQKRDKSRKTKSKVKE